jgi:hypothetical protein
VLIGMRPYRYPPTAMRPPGSYKIASRNRAFDAYLDPEVRSARRASRIVESLRSEILEWGAGEQVRIRRIFSNPREIFRLELELPELGYQRTTLLDRDALEQLLECDDVRALVRHRAGLG